MFRTGAARGPPSISPRRCPPGDANYTAVIYPQPHPQPVDNPSLSWANTACMSTFPVGNTASSPAGITLRAWCGIRGRMAVDKRLDDLRRGPEGRLRAVTGRVTHRAVAEPE